MGIYKSGDCDLLNPNSLSELLYHPPCLKKAENLQGEKIAARALQWFMKRWIISLKPWEIEYAFEHSTYSQNG